MIEEIKPVPGEKAPAFQLPDEKGELVSLSQFKGKWLVLYFYPKDNTSGCTIEAIDFTFRVKDFQRLNAAITGVSPDSCESHKKFMLKHDLGIILLSDSEKSVLSKYGVWQKKKMYGKESMGVVRSTFLIDPDGIVRQVWRKVKVKDHVEEVYAVLKNITSSQKKG